MYRERWILGVVFGVLALCVLGALSSRPWDATTIAVTSNAPPTPSTRRISAAGVHYGDCDGVALAVLLFPEPCDWDRARRDPTLASR